MRAPLTHLCVFAGSNHGNDRAFVDAASEVGRLLARRGIHLVYGGGAVGLMGVMADAALAVGGEVTGVIPRSLLEKEVGHRGLTEMLVVDSMHERKLAMADRSQAFLALPGGTGTFEELFEAFTWTQLGIHHKPVGVLDVAGYYRPLLDMLDAAVVTGFVTPAHRHDMLSAVDPEDLLEAFAAWEPSTVSKWLDFEDR